MAAVSSFGAVLSPEDPLNSCSQPGGAFVGAVEWVNALD